MRASIVWLCVAAIPLSGCSGCESAAPTPAAAPATVPAVFAERAKDLPIENAAKVAEGVWRGAQPDGAGLRALKERGFRTIVNLRSSHSERKEAEALGLEAVEIPLVADVKSRPPTDAEVERFFEVVLDPAKRPVYVHCALGCDRTGTMLALYRIEVDGWSNADALREMEHFGFHGYYADLETFVRGYRPRGYRPPAR